MDYHTIIFDEPEAGIGRITLNRPEKLNAINLEMLEELHDLYEKLCCWNHVRVLILAASGRGFCSGADLTDERMLRQAPEYYKDPATFLDRIQKTYSNMIIELRRAPQPIIALVQGAAAGGGFSMALAADIIYAGPRAKFIASFINIGLSGGELGTTYFLPKKIGANRAAEVLMTGAPLGAEEAERFGLVNRLVPEDALEQTAMETARIMLTKSYMGLKQTKEAMNQNLTAQNLEAAIELENRNQTICAFSADFKAAIDAFIGGKNG